MDKEDLKHVPNHLLPVVSILERSAEGAIVKRDRPLAHQKIPVDGLPKPHTHAIIITEEGSQLLGLMFYFKYIEFMGESDEGFGIWNFEYEIVPPPPVELPPKAQVDKVVADILDKILKDSAEVSELESREAELEQALLEAGEFVDETPVQQNEDGTITEFVEVPMDD